jgi:DNA-binding NarL/FixJ family response regulator
MKRHIFLTRRPEALTTWTKAFPDAEFAQYPEPGQLLAKPGEAVIWLHICADRPDPASLVQIAGLAAPRCPIVVLSNVPNDEEGLAVLEAGAVGYTGSLAIAEMLIRIAAVIENGGLWVGPGLMQRLLTAIATRTSQFNSSSLDRLSGREKEVALAVAGGASNREVAQRLDITERTVKAHLTAIFERLDVRDRLQLSLLINGAPDLSTPPARNLH